MFEVDSHIVSASQNAQMSGHFGVEARCDYLPLHITFSFSSTGTA